MSSLTNVEKMKFEKFFEMGGRGSGFVLDFSDRTFQDFILSATGLDIQNDKYINGSNSKAQRLRAFIQKESDAVVGKLFLEMLEYWKAKKLIEGISIPQNEQDLLEDCRNTSNRLLGKELRGTITPTNHTKISVFISYSTLDKEIAGTIKDVLSEFNIEVFLAHDDIAISEEWKQVILQKIYECNVFIALLTPNFKKSDWTSQEIGVVIGKRDNTLILPLKVGDAIPYGFIASIQGGNLGTKTGWTYSGISELLKKIFLKFPELMFDKLMKYLATSGSWRDAEGRLKFVLGALQNPVPIDKLNKILDVSAGNSEIWWAGGNIEWITAQLMNKEIDKTIVDKFRSLEPYKEALELFS